MGKLPVVILCLLLEPNGNSSLLSTSKFGCRYLLGILGIDMFKNPDITPDFCPLGGDIDPLIEFFFYTMGNDLMLFPIWKLEGLTS
jgi:hypothetical protein